MKKLLALLFALLAAPAGAQVIPSGPNGSLNYWGVGGLSQVLNPGLAGQCLTTQGVGSAPVWVNCQVSSLSLLPPINTNQFYGNVSGQFGPPVGVDVNTILNTVGYDIARPPPVEAIIYKSNVGPLFNWQALPPGTPGSLLTSGGPTNPPFWAANQIQANLSGICTTVGAVLYFDTPSLQWKCLNPGTTGQVLETNGASANPSWVTGSALTSNNDTNVTVTLAGGPSTALLQPSSITMGWTGTLAAGRLNSNVVQSFTNDTNVTAAISAQNATLGWTGTLAVARGGTGAATAAAAISALMPTPTRAGDVVYWNGSNWVTLAGNNSGTNVLQETSAGVPSWAAPGTGTVNTAGTGISLTSAGSTVNLALTNATLQANPTNPTATTSAGVMMGLGTTCKLTPVYSGRLMLNFIGDIKNDTAGSTSTNKVFFGTGTAPINGAATTGTQVANAQSLDEPTASLNIPFSNGGIITGLTPGTAYWFDINLGSSGSHTATISNLSCNAMEF